MAEAGEGPIDIVQKQEPVVETAESMTYLGVRVEKGKKTENVPERSQGFVYTKTALEMMRDIGIGIQTRTPVLFEAGSGLGKTTTATAVAAEIDRELYEISCNPQTDGDDFWGSWLPNPNRQSNTDPAYIFHPGPLTLALSRAKDGVKTMMLVNEPNAARDGLKILNGVFDALAKNATIEIPSPDGSMKEKISTDGSATAIVLTANAASKDYDVLPGSKDFLTRVNKITLPENPPPEDLTHYNRARLKRAPHYQEVPDESFMFTNEIPLTPDKLLEIPEFADTMELLDVFHNEVMTAMEEGDIESRNEQGESYGIGSYKQIDRIWEFMGMFCREGAVLPTFQKALQYYYSNRMSGSDREHVNKMIEQLGKEPSEESEEQDSHIDRDFAK